MLNTVTSVAMYTEKREVCGTCPVRYFYEMDMRVSVCYIPVFTEERKGLPSSCILDSEQVLGHMKIEVMRPRRSLRVEGEEIYVSSHLLLTREAGNFPSLSPSVKEFPDLESLDISCALLPNAKHVTSHIQSISAFFLRFSTKETGDRVPCLEIRSLFLP